jgi:AAA+ ATPase superfamily predicted ATPase
MASIFVGRERELKLLDDLWARQDAQFLILYGRRRVGKTRLLTHWMHHSGARALYWVAEPTSAHVQLRSFSQAVYNFANPQAPAPLDFSYANWDQAWQQLAALASTQRLAFFLDEFTYLLQSDPSLAGKLQNLWDHLLSQRNLLLVISGSHLGMMKRELLSYQAPLYGRATAQLALQPMPFSALRRLFPHYTPAERVTLYAMFGGIPAYWERIDPGLSISQNIRAQLLTPNNLMQAEPLLLLQDFISEPQNYIAILGAIANDARTPKEIADLTGLSNIHVPKYLSVLAEAGFVERRIPVNEHEPSRSGRHHITDPYLRFYYRFLASRQGQLALGVQDQSLAEINRHLVDFIGTHTWEEICREWLLRSSASGGLPFLPDRVGSAWNKQAQVDVAGINWMEKTLFLGECKWSPEAMERKMLVDLVEKAGRIVPKNGQWQVYFLGFARSGWNSAARRYANTLATELPHGENWHALGLRLLSLPEVEEDLWRWTGGAEQ